MQFAIKPNGLGRPVSVRAITDNGALLPGETFRLPESTVFEDKVLAEDGISLRASTLADKRAAQAAQNAASVGSSGESLVMKVIGELMKDIAALKGVNSSQYALDVLSRLGSS